MKPAVTRPDLISEMIADELLIYDPQDSSCHCLTPQATVVWQGIQAQLDSADIEARLRERFPDLGQPPADVVAAALLEFRTRNLLESEPEQPSPLKPSRRKVLKAIGMGLIATIVAPLPAAAISRRVTITGATYFANNNTYRGIGFGGVSCTLGTNPSPSSGTLDCTASLASYVTTAGNGEMTGFIPSNTSCGSDPIVGVQKLFKVIYRCDGGTARTLFLCETETITVYC